MRRLKVGERSHLSMKSIEFGFFTALASVSTRVLAQVLVRYGSRSL